MSGATCAAPPAAECRRDGGWRRQLLAWAFALFNGLRMLAYLPTAWAIHASGDTSAHSLWTWAVWLGANLTMAGWLRERNGGRPDRAVLVSLGNASMCALMLAVLAWHR